MILPPTLKRWGPPRRQGLCSHLAHLWATSDSAPRSKGTHNPFLILLPALGIGDPQECRGDIAILPSFGPSFFLLPFVFATMSSTGVLRNMCKHDLPSAQPTYKDKKADLIYKRVFCDFI